MNKKNTLLLKLKDPVQISRRVGNASIPNVEFKGKQWAVIGSSIVLDMIIDKLIGAAFGGPAGTVWLIFQMASLFVDMVDPYGYNQALNRDLVNEITTNVLNQLKDILKKQIPEVKSRSYQQLKERGLTDEQIDETINNVLSGWTKMGPIEELGYKCFGDMETEGKLSGPPTAECNSIYKEFYEEFVLREGEKYLKPPTPENNAEINKALGTIYEFLVDQNIKTYRETVIKFNSLVLVVIFIIILFILVFKKK